MNMARHSVMLTASHGIQSEEPHTEEFLDSKLWLNELSLWSSAIKELQIFQIQKISYVLKETEKIDVGKRNLPMDMKTSNKMNERIRNR